MDGARFHYVDEGRGPALLLLHGNPSWSFVYRKIVAVTEMGRRRWKATSGYHQQARVENAFFRYKSIIGDGLRARSQEARGPRSSSRATSSIR